MPHLFDRKTDSFFGALSYLGYALLLAGVVLGSSPWWYGPASAKVQMLLVGGLLLSLGVLFKFTFHGFQLDFQNRRLREYLSMFGFKTGKWAPLPAFNKVVLSSNLQAAEDHGHSHDHEPAPAVMWYTIGLYSHPQEADYELRTDNQQDALKTLRLLAGELGIPAEDRTSISASNS